MFQQESNLPLKLIADSVLKLSDFYIQNPKASTPWETEFCQIAYRSYFLPLNYLRCLRVFTQALKTDFFTDLSYFIDWGCGPGTASLALLHLEAVKKNMQKQILIDQSKMVLNHFQDLHQDLVKAEKTTETKLSTYLDQKHRTCLIFSYSLTEVDELPKAWDQFEALIILEPSTSQDSRKLLELRKKLIEKNYAIWAPCVHQLNCPLLTESKTDWCHDRIKVEAPDWFLELEQLLPMKNKTITTSYLVARKKKPNSLQKNIGRLTGDSREENGKTRQLVCRNDKREFLTWMHKHVKPQTFPRGELVLLPEDIQIKSNELRVKENCKLLD